VVRYFDPHVPSVLHNGQGPQSEKDLESALGCVSVANTNCKKYAPESDIFTLFQLDLSCLTIYDGKTNGRRR